jgi:hypothetical protein
MAKQLAIAYLFLEDLHTIPTFLQANPLSFSRQFREARRVCALRILG